MEKVKKKGFQERGFFIEKSRDAISRAEERIRAEGNVIHLAGKKRLVVMSDLHRGYGNGNDNFARNQMIFLAALRYYLREGYSYLELGDGDELWENRHMDGIIREYAEIFRVMGEFYKKNRFYMVYGNHDKIKKNRDKIRKKWCSVEKSCMGGVCPLFPDLAAKEGYIIRQEESKQEFLAIHGHQGDPVNDKFSMVSSFLVRRIWGPLERVGLKNPGEKSMYQKARNIQEKRLKEWAKKRRCGLVAGHTHQIGFPCEENGYYYNCGCGVKNGYITALEFDKEKVSLIKWEVVPDRSGTLMVERQELS